jgi:catechol 2,3-dioxygenase-like lactoylglutathione lyase family enzyme
MVHIASTAPVLLVADVFETAEYYRDVLGFRFDEIYGEPPSFVIVERDGARLMFRQPREGAPQPNNGSVVPHFPTDVFLWVDDVEALAAELHGKHAEVLHGPTYRPIWNGKELEVRDCNGRVLCFGQSMGDD